MFIYAYQMVLAMDGISRDKSNRNPEMFCYRKSELSLLLNGSMNSTHLIRMYDTSWLGHSTLDRTVVVVLGNGYFFYFSELHNAAAEPKLND